MAAVIQVDKCYVAVVEPLDDIEKLRQSSIYSQDVGLFTILYGNSEQFFENLNNTESVKLVSLTGEVAAMITL